MALQIALAATPFGPPAPAAYVKVANVAVDKEAVRAFVAVYFDAAARQADARPLDQKLHVLKTADLTGDILPAVYAALKALPEYASATDC